MHKSAGLVGEGCVKTALFYTRFLNEFFAVETTAGFYTGFARMINTFLLLSFGHSTTVKSVFYSLSTGPITITTNKLYKGVY